MYMCIYSLVLYIAMGNIKCDINLVLYLPYSGKLSKPLYGMWSVMKSYHTLMPRPIPILTRYTHAHHVPHAEHVKSSKWRSSKHCRDDAVLSSAYPVHGSVSKANRSGADAQVVSCHRYLVVFHSFIEQLTVFHISGLVRASSSMLLHMPKGM